MATNNFVSRFNISVSSKCPFCNDVDNVFHLFCGCFRLESLFVLLDKMMSKFGFLFNKTMFIFGNGYRCSWKGECKLANFLLGQAKLAILKSHQCKNEDQNVDLLMMFKSLVKSRIVTEYTFYLHTKHVILFEIIWGVKKAVVTVNQTGLVFHW